MRLKYTDFMYLKQYNLGKCGFYVLLLSLSPQTFQFNINFAFKTAFSPVFCLTAFSLRNTWKPAHLRHLIPILDLKSKKNAKSEEYSSGFPAILSLFSIYKAQTKE